MSRATFVLHGLKISVRSDDHRVTDALVSRLLPFVDRAPGGTERSTLGVVDFRFERSRGGSRLGDRSTGRPVYDTDLGDVLYQDHGDRLTIDCGTVSVDARLSEGTVHTTYTTANDEQIALAAHPLFTLPLLEMAKRRGLFPLHAAAVARQGRAALFPAPSGSGKSTLAIALARAGAGLLSDDMVFLRGPSPEIECLGFPDELDVTDDTAAMFGELEHLVGRPTWGSRPKHQVRGESIGLTTMLDAEPAVLVFPHLTHRRDTTAEPMSTAAALIEMTPNVLLTDASSTQSHLSMLGALASSVPCFALGVGTDLDLAVDVVRDLLR